MWPSRLNLVSEAEEDVYQSVCRTWPRAIIDADYRKALIPCGVYTAELCWEELDGAMFFTLNYFETRIVESKVALVLCPGEFTACFPINDSPWCWDEVTKRLFLLRTPPIATTGSLAQ